MKIKDVRDSFMADYIVEAKVRGVEVIPLTDKQIALWISEAQSDIQRRLRIGITYYDITTVDGVNTYVLPTDFGSVIKVESEGSDLVQKGVSDVVSTTDIEAGKPREYMIWAGEGAYKITFNEPEGDIVVRIWYYQDYGTYKASEGDIQDWGQYDGVDFTGDMRLPNNFLAVVKLYMLSKIFKDMYALYEREVEKIKESRGYTGKRVLSYRMGGF